MGGAPGEGGVLVDPLGNSRRAVRVIETLLLGGVLCATNLRGLAISRDLVPIWLASVEALLEVALVLVAFWLLWRSGRLRSFRDVWSTGWPVWPLLAIALASTVWSIAPAVTLGRSVVLLSCTALAAVLAVRYCAEGILDMAAVWFLVLIILSIFFAAARPGLGIMEDPPYTGSWRGIFWHRNYLGSTMALGALVLLAAFLARLERRPYLASMYGVLYVLALALVILSRSATGLILTLILHVLLALAWLWTKWQSRLRPRSYWALGGAAGALLALAFAKLDLLLGLFNRNTTFTGRVGLWRLLLDNIFIQRPLLGHGFGALWSLPGFQLAMRDAMRWPYSIFIGDNGYLDIALHLGGLGLLALVVALGWCLVRTTRWLRQQGTLVAAVPFIAVVYLLITNVTLSYFVETESFTWMLVMAFVFSAGVKETSGDTSSKISMSRSA
jgi:exopolysaccharide production protein ExoQ